MTKFVGLPVLTSTDMIEDYGKYLIHGPQGSGKTTLASTIAELGPTLFIDLVGEKGTRSFRGAPYTKNIHVVRPASITALDDIFWKLNSGDHPYKCAVIDSLTAVQKMSMRFILGHDETAVREIKQGVAPADQRAWGQTLDIMVDTSTFWFGLADGDRAKPMHIVMTAQTKINDDDFGNTIRTPDVQKGALSITLASPDYILYTDVEEDLDSEVTPAPLRHIVRFGASMEYRTKGRVPVNLRGKIPSILGRTAPLSLVSLSRKLGVGGVPAAPARRKKPAAITSTATN